MDIREMTDEQLALKLRKVGEDNNVTVIHGGLQMWLAVAKFVRQCVKDSTPKGLTLEEIKDAINDWLSCGESRLSPDDVDEIATAIHAAQERKGKDDSQQESIGLKQAMVKGLEWRKDYYKNV